MLPTLPEKWVYGEKAPFRESSLVEFKEVTVFSGLFRHKSHGSSGLPKYRETIVAFLNSGQGYLIMGVKDNGLIVGVENMTDEMVDKFKLWIDGSFNNIVYRNGKPLDPSIVSIKFYNFPVVGSQSNIIVIEAINKCPKMGVMTRSGSILYRLNASNFKVSSEPIYRKRDVKGMIHSIHIQMQGAIDEKRRTIIQLQEKHREEIKEIVRGQGKEVRDYIDKISLSLYNKYRIEEKSSLCSIVQKLVSTLYSYL